MKIKPYTLEWNEKVDDDPLAPNTFKYRISGVIAENENKEKILHVFASYEGNPWGVKSYFVSDERILNKIKEKNPEIKRVRIYKFQDEKTAIEMERIVNKYDKVAGEKGNAYSKFMGNVLGLTFGLELAAMQTNLAYAALVFFFSTMFFSALFEAVGEEIENKIYSRTTERKIAEILKANNVKYKEYTI